MLPQNYENCSRHLTNKAYGKNEYTMPLCIIHCIYSQSHKLLYHIPYDAFFSLLVVAERQGES